MRKCGVFIVLLSFTAVLCVSEKVSYAGYTINRVTVKNDRDAELALKLEGKDGYNFWTAIDLVNHKVDIMVSPSNQEEFKKYLDDNSLVYITIVEDVGSLSDNLTTMSRTRKSALNRASTYMSCEEILSYLMDLSKLINPKCGERLLTLERIGNSSEGRDVHMAKISSDHGQNKPIVLLDAAMHAREWSGPPTLLYLTQQLTENFTHNSDILRHMDIYVIPVVNPDGYEYSLKFDRMWRKTRSEHGGCIGVDVNRNFNHYWGVSGASNDPCSEAFKGPFPFSEKETQNLRNVGIRYGIRTLGYISVHSYGYFLLHPWGYTKELPEDWENLDTCAKSFVDKVEEFSGAKYKHGSSSRVLYKAAGGSDDWFKGKIGVPFAYTMELPGSDDEGFYMSPERLPDVGRETFEGLKEMFNCFLRFYKNGGMSMNGNYDSMIPADEE